MRLRTKYITTIICMIIILLAMVVSVWAIFSQGYTINDSTITFIANSIDATINGKVYNNNYEKDGRGEEGNLIEIATGFENDLPWEIGKVSFKGVGESNALKIRMAVSNDSVTKNLYVSGVTAPELVNSDIVEFNYNYGWGILPEDKTWESVDLHTVTTDETATFKVENQTTDATSISLNEENVRYLKPKVLDDEDSALVVERYFFILEITIVLKSSRLSITQSIDFAIYLQ